MFYKLTPVRISIFALLGVALFLGSCGQEDVEPTTELAWVATYDEALDLAREENKPVMIDFHAEWCSWCKTLDNKTYSHRDVIAASSDFISLKIDADVHRDITQRYRVTGLPTILFVDASGKEIHRVVGYRPADKFLDEINTALENFRAES
jgi:thiol:disulfide interchange protein DsbD